MIITRFAPSPTGYMHIGNARTAIFNYLLAKHYGGKMLLRIEDTDKQRSTKEAVDTIFDSLRFLGVEWDGDVVYQSKNADKHTALAYKLIESGAAYKDSEGVTRFNIPDEGEIAFEDQVYGQVSLQNKDLEDFALLRSDGSPTYLLAVVADDHEMQVNYIIRGSDHLTNTFKQLHLIRALGFEQPKYAHLPLIHDMSGQKMSKRHGAVCVLDFAQKGILPEALLNYLMRLGWGKGDEEFVPLDRAIEIFDESGFGRSAAKFDQAKLLDLSGKYMRYLCKQSVLEAAKKFYKNITIGQNSDIIYDEKAWDRFAAGLDSLRIRCNTLTDLLDMGKIFLERDVPPIEQPYAELHKLLQFMKQVDFDETLDSCFRSFCLESGIEFKDAARWLRYKLTGRKMSPSLFDVALGIGRELTIHRMMQDMAI